MLNIVIPMAGRGSRFENAGYVDPKPLIPVHGVPMIAAVIENLRPSLDHRFIFLCQQRHLDEYPLESVLKNQSSGCEILGLQGVTAGAACTVLLAKEWIDNDQPLMIANCDQWVDTSIDQYLADGMEPGVDAFLMTMRDDSPKWSYVQRDENGRISGVVEKVVVSDEATVGIYNFARGSDFVSATQKMIREDDRSRGEFYVAPVYSRLADQGMQIKASSIGNAGDAMHGLGTPEDLDRFLTLGYESAIGLAFPDHLA